MCDAGRKVYPIFDTATRSHRRVFRIVSWFDMPREFIVLILAQY
jgi:hypothetical protein